MTAKACNKLKRADAELNRVYQQVLAAKATDADFVKAFREAQRAWISFRDAHVTSILPDPDLTGVRQRLHNVPVRNS
jgi:uncharacterized protein YecT (DUF1311 family)